jgi:hypothetical protein
MLLMFCGMGVFTGRSEDGDWQAWTEASWSQKFDYGLELGLRFEGRMEEDFSSFNYYEIEPMVNWRYSPRWDFTVGYERDERFEPMEEVSHVPNVAATMKLPLNRYFLSNRFRMDYMIPEESEESEQTIYRNRTQFQMDWKWGSKMLVPFIFDEWFLNLNETEITENRAGIGIGIPIVPHWTAQLYWMRLDEKVGQEWEWHPVIGAQLQLVF